MSQPTLLPALPLIKQSADMKWDKQSNKHRTEEGERQAAPRVSFQFKMVILMWRCLCWSWFKRVKTCWVVCFKICPYLSVCWPDTHVAAAVDPPGGQVSVESVRNRMRFKVRLLFKSMWQDDRTGFPPSTGGFLLVCFPIIIQIPYSSHFTLQRRINTWYLIFYSEEHTQTLRPN